MWYVIIAVGILACAVMAIQVQRLLVSALWLAGTSALVAMLIYLLGAPEIAVIELSVGAGLVTVLFVFAINIAGEENRAVQAMIPKPLGYGSVILAVIIAGWLCLPTLAVNLPVSPALTLGSSLWGDRAVDTVLQVVLIFAGVLGVLGLLAEGKTHASLENKA
ncbi:MAG: NADH-quinone oxidoreductase subunit J [Anaerolineaceae bacterium]|jgi:uncharacterized MnhB-related membrane protein